MNGATVGEKLLEVVAKIGEKIDINKYEIATADSVAGIHTRRIQNWCIGEHEQSC